MGAVLVAFGIVHGLRQVVDVPPQGPVLAVVLTLTLGRTLSRAHHATALVVAEVPLLGVAATCAGWLVLHEPWIGQPLLVLALCVGVLARRWGGLARQAGRLVTLPFLAILVTPIPTVDPRRGLPLTVGSLLWGAVVGVVAVTCALAARRVLARLAPRVRPLPSPAPRRSTRQLDAGTRAAIQLLVALGAALALGHLLFGDRWVWPLLSAYIVLAGARGRGDVVHKAGLRVVGAAVGTAAATALTIHALPVGNRWLIVGVFVVMAVSLVLRGRSYAFWAAGVTAMIALVGGFYGATEERALPERVLGVLLGCALGVAVAWFVLPTRTRDVLRLYLAGCLAALTDDLAPERSGPPTTPDALRLLDELVPTLRAHRRSLGRGGDLHALDAVLAAHRLASVPEDPADRRRLRRDVIRVRRAIVGKDDPPPDELPPDLAIVHRVIRATQVRQRIGAGAYSAADGSPAATAATAATTEAT